MKLAASICTPCRDGTGLLSQNELQELHKECPAWALSADAQSIMRRLKFSNFAKAYACVGQIAGIAESQGHHPDITFGWGYVEITLTTHEAKGLTRNDFIVAAHIDQLQ
jgi:4a-hydroxytetrahydrobiopterin dehydratase